MDKVNEKLGTNYKLFNYYGAEDADRVIIADVYPAREKYDGSVHSCDLAQLLTVDN